MNPEMLDRLLLDRALGALSDDAAALLDAWLARDPQAARRAGEYAAAVAAGRNALGGDAAAGALPPFPAGAVRTARQTRRRLLVLRRVVGIAAALMLGIGLGATVFRTDVAPRAARETGGLAALSAPSSAGPSIAQVSAGRGGFWSVERLVQTGRAAAARPAGTRLIWNSVVALPRLGGV
jgi:anti-sigma factor RsiW